MLQPERNSWQTRLLLLAAACVIAAAIFRAWTQSITYDEAFSCLFFAKSFELAMVFHSNNHLLNTVLMWAAIEAFGRADLVLRIPALIGAVLYICVCYSLCRRLTEQFSLRLILFVCLTCNPFLLDFMVAARGYSLANGFFTAAIAIPILHRDERSLKWSCMCASAALGFSFTANYSFAFAGLAAWLAILLWALRSRTQESVVSIAAFCTLPGIAVTLAICGYTLGHWQTANWKGDLWWGAHSLQETRDSLVQSSLFQVSPRFPGPLFTFVSDVKPWLFPVLGLLALCQALAMGWDRSWLQDPRSRWIGGRAAMLAAIGSASLGLSWLAFHFYGLPLPLGRTGMYFVPIATLMVGMIAAIGTRSALSSWLRRATFLALGTLACYFLLCFRVSYFQEYRWDADTKQVYGVLAQLNRNYGITDVETAGLFMTALNYYRELSGRETFPEFKIHTPEISPGHAVYVLDGNYWRDFVQKENLAIIYKGPFSEAVVAVPRGGSIPPLRVIP